MVSKRLLRKETYGGGGLFNLEDKGVTTHSAGRLRMVERTCISLGAA